MHELQIYRVRVRVGFPKHSVWETLHSQLFGAGRNLSPNCLSSSPGRLNPQTNTKDSKDLGGRESFPNPTSLCIATRQAPAWARVRKRLVGGHLAPTNQSSGARPSKLQA